MYIILVEKTDWKLLRAVSAAVINVNVCYDFDEDMLS